MQESYAATAIDRRPIPLTEREIEVIEIVTRGLTNAEAGGVLGVSLNTVKKHLASAFRKLDVSSRAELTRVYLEGPAAASNK